LGLDGPIFLIETFAERRIVFSLKLRPAARPFVVLDVPAGEFALGWLACSTLLIAAFTGLIAASTVLIPPPAAVAGSVAITGGRSATATAVTVTITAAPSTATTIPPFASSAAIVPGA